MTRFEVGILPEAEAEIREAFLWYFARSPIAADAFRTETLEVIDQLATDALIWPEGDTQSGGIFFVISPTQSFTRFKTTP